MSFGTHRFEIDGDDFGDMHEINMTPLVDVMLVLLVVFMVTLPVIKHAVNINLPNANASSVKAKQEPVRLTVTADGAYQWNERRVDSTELSGLLTTNAVSADAAAIQLQGDAAVRYDKVAQVMAMAQRAGVQKMSVITQAVR
jgi:biopolymer transport protein ExbD